MRAHNESNFQTDYTNYIAQDDHAWFHNSETHSEAVREAEDDWAQGFSHFGQSAAPAARQNFGQTATLAKDGYALVGIRQNPPLTKAQQFLGVQADDSGFAHATAVANRWTGSHPTPNSTAAPAVNAATPLVASPPFAQVPAEP